MTTQHIRVKAPINSRTCSKPQLSQTWHVPRLRRILAFLPRQLINTSHGGWLPCTNMKRGTWNPKKPALENFASEKTRKSRGFYSQPMVDSTNQLQAGCWLRSFGTSKTERVIRVYVSGSCQKVLNKLQQWEGQHKKSLISDMRRDAELLIALRNNRPKESKTS